METDELTQGKGTNSKCAHLVRGLNCVVVPGPTAAALVRAVSEVRLELLQTLPAYLRLILGTDG